MPQQPPSGDGQSQNSQSSAAPSDVVNAKLQRDPVFLSIVNELNVNADQLEKRKKLISKIERVLTERYGNANRLMSYVMRFGHARTMMHTADIAGLEAVLNSISGADQINLLLHSPGGDGTIVEKMVEMCRTHLSGTNPKLRVIVPNIAKSAATILSLGADQVLMGYTSELGPIDPQVQIAVSGTIQWVSALAFIEARDKLMDQINEAIKKNEPTVGLLQQLAGLNVPFTNECATMVEFSRKTGVRLLDKYMLKPGFPKDEERNQRANEITDKLLSRQIFQVHGQYIDAQTAKDLGLEIEVLSNEDELWQLIWDYYIRCEIQMNIPLNPGFIKTKLFESSQVSLTTQDTAT